MEDIWLWWRCNVVGKCGGGVVMERCHAKYSLTFAKGQYF